MLCEPSSRDRGQLAREHSNALPNTYILQMVPDCAICLQMQIRTQIIEPNGHVLCKYNPHPQQLGGGRVKTVSICVSCDICIHQWLSVASTDSFYNHCTGVGTASYTKKRDRVTLEDTMHTS